MLAHSLNQQVGCEDGRVRLFQITADDLMYSKSLDQQEGINLFAVKVTVNLGGCGGCNLQVAG